MSSQTLPLGSLALGEPGIVALTPGAYASLAYQGLWVAAITYLAWFWMIRHYPAPKLASFTFITPLFGVVAGWIVLDEAITAALIVAAGLVALGVYLVNRPGQ